MIRSVNCGKEALRRSLARLLCSLKTRSQLSASNVPSSAFTVPRLVSPSLREAPYSLPFLQLPLETARNLTQGIYRTTGGASFSKDFGLRDQVQRATVSIMANIVHPVKYMGWTISRGKGFDANSDDEFVRFLRYALRSATEVQSHRMGQYVGSGAQYKTLRESLTSAVSAPLRRLKYISHSAIHNPGSASSPRALC